jgi:UTP:GlnB (protein PII) uridylyltransferase
VGAVSPDTLTPWKEELLWRLYVDAYNQMTIGYGDEIIDRKEADVAALQGARPADIPESEMARFWKGCRGGISCCSRPRRSIATCGFRAI